jgi:hypothetical protein
MPWLSFIFPREVLQPGTICMDSYCRFMNVNGPVVVNTSSTDKGDGSIVTNHNNNKSKNRIGCDTSLQVTSLIMVDNRLQGQIQEEILALPRLQLINLCHNDLTGHLPKGITFLPALEMLD